ncbi:MAG TPA: hypothetical protein ENI72_03635, partial [Rhodospirillales bacterium]|nr:hypothetical protein [Rhodospirillales bacterium]
RYYEDSRELAHRLTEWSKSLKVGNRRFVICTGGGPGIMEAANREVELAGANKAGMFIHLMPLFGGGLAVVFLGETPRLFHAVGLVLILSGIYFVTRRERS